MEMVKSSFIYIAHFIQRAIQCALHKVNHKSAEFKYAKQTGTLT